jgi:hypothetical protein
LNSSTTNCCEALSTNRRLEVGAEDEVAVVYHVRDDNAATREVDVGARVLCARVSGRCGRRFRAGANW